ncbi:hypothetical protein [Sulfitobacter sp.]|uniref:hypothetical protein n=1 Tax=Sulfitobacter sp. TaxID=1903071 RepID=UPI0035632DFE
MSVIDQLEGLCSQRAVSLLNMQAEVASFSKAVQQCDDAVQFLKRAQDDLDRIGFDPEVTFGDGGRVNVAFDLPDFIVSVGFSHAAASTAIEAVEVTDTPEPVRLDVPDTVTPAPPEPKPEPTRQATHKTGPWTAAELRIVAAAVENGKTCEEIATTLNRTKGGVGMKMKAIAREAAKAPITVPDAPSEVKVPAREVKAAADAVTRKKRAACAPKPPEQTLSAEDRAINTHLDAVGYKGGWSKLMDFEILSGLMKGKGAALVADELGVETGDLVSRFKAINTKAGDLPHQTRLLRVLRMRAGV